MTVSTGFPIKVSIVQALRASSALKAGIATARGKPVDQPGNYLHEGFAPEKTPYPFVTYTQVYGPKFYTWGSVMLHAGFDVGVWSENSVEANDLFALIAAELDEADLPVAGQSTLICRNVADLTNQDVDEEGKKIYFVGATYEVWTDKPLARRIPGSFTMDAVIV